MDVNIYNDCISFFYGVREMMTGCNDMAENPCSYTNLDCTRIYKTNYVDIKVGDNDGET